jgi:hypothetical protein
MWSVMFLARGTWDGGAQKKSAGGIVPHAPFAVPLSAHLAIISLIAPVRAI